MMRILIRGKEACLIEGNLASGPHSRRWGCLLLLWQCKHLEFFMKNKPSQRVSTKEIELHDINKIDLNMNEYAERVVGEAYGQGCGRRTR
jgi:hypothetical protein